MHERVATWIKIADLDHVTISIFVTIIVFHKELSVWAAMGMFQGEPVVLVNEHVSIP